MNHKGMGWGVVEGIQIVLHKSESIDELEWNSYLEDVVRQRISGVVIFTLTGFNGPSTLQRKQIAVAWEEKGVSVPPMTV